MSSRVSTDQGLTNRADRRLPDVLFEDLCFDAQQAAERALKAVLISGGRRFPRTHDLAELLHLVAAMGLDLPPEVLEAKRLTPYAVAGARTRCGVTAG
jgi:HEPN domain-containing protein